MGALPSSKMATFAYPFRFVCPFPRWLPKISSGRRQRLSLKSRQPCRLRVRGRPAAYRFFFPDMLCEFFLRPFARKKESAWRRRRRRRLLTTWRRLLPLPPGGEWEAAAVGAGGRRDRSPKGDRTGLPSLSFLSPPVPPCPSSGGKVPGGQWEAKRRGGAGSVGARRGAGAQSEGAVSGWDCKENKGTGADAKEHRS